MGYGFGIATQRCYGCKTCTVACTSSHGLPPRVLLRRVRQLRLEDPVGHAFLSMSCNHCDSPACVANCPVGAYVKMADTGLVVQDHTMCIGCKICVGACPFGAPYYNPDDATTYKCDGCVGRLELGLSPACVEACPSGVIMLGAYTELTAALGEDAGTGSAGIDVKALAETQPNLVATLDEHIDATMLTKTDNLPQTVDRGSGPFYAGAQLTSEA